MAPNKNKKKAEKPNKKTVLDYIDGVKLTPSYYWEKGDWSRCHGDNKSTTNGVYVTETQMSSTNPPEYLVHVTLNGKVLIHFSMGNTQPTDEETWERLKEEIKKAF